MVSFFFLRHGPSEWNLVKRWQGQKNPALSESGKELAQKWAEASIVAGFGKKFNSENYVPSEAIEIWSSDLDRAVDTAKIIADTWAKSDVGNGKDGLSKKDSSLKQFGEGTDEKSGNEFVDANISIQTDERLRERFLADWEGLTRKEIDKRWPGAISKRAFPTEAENDDQVVSRVLDWMGERAKKVSAPILVVSHGGLITCLEEYLGQPWKRLSNLRGRWFHLDKTLLLGDRVDYLGNI